MLCAVLALVAHLTLPVELDGIGLERARHLSGEPFAYPEWNQTHVGARTRDDGAERVAVLGGVRYAVKAGERVRLVGVLEVIDHPPAFVGAVLVPAWTEVRVSEVRP